ncbi:MAG: hypothetical protein L0G89_06665 [Janibacter sp.]|nr:hypothetical protein [Janibacter sp.]
MASTPATRTRRDAGASVFAYAIAGVALLVHVFSSLTDRWWSDELVLLASDGTGQRTVLVPVSEVPGWVTTVFRVADVVEWLAAAAVLICLTACVVGMMRGDVFTRRTAWWATASSWAAVSLLLLPFALRLPATNMALQSAPGAWDAQLLDEGWWYLYIGMMTLSFLALVLRRGSQLQADQAGLI